MTIRESINPEMLLVVYLRHIYSQGRTYAVETQRVFLDAIDRLAECLGCSVRLKHLTDGCVSRYWDYCVMQCGLKESTTDKYARAIRALWRHAIEQGVAAPSRIARRKDDPGSGRLASVVLEEREGTLWWHVVHRYFTGNLRILSPLTRHQYEVAVRDFARHLQRMPELHDLNDDTLVAWMKWMRDRGLAMKTINERSGRIVSVWTWLAKKRLVDLFPTVPRFKEPKRTPRAWTVSEIGRIFVAARAATGRVGGFRKSDYWLALLSVLWDSGERISAVMQCKWAWLDWETRVLSIPAEARKSDERDMVYTLHADTIVALRQIYVPDSELIFFFPFCQSTLFNHFKAILSRAGLPHDRTCGFHKIRRSVASHLEAAGHNASMVLRHSSPAITVKSYIDPAIVNASRPSEVLFRPGGQSEPIAVVNGRATPFRRRVALKHVNGRKDRA